MDNLFHENVDNDYVEYFMQDLFKNLTTLNDSLIALGRETSDKSKSALFKKISWLREIINEEINMFNDLLKFRVLTLAEEKLADEIKWISNSAYILEYKKEMAK